MGLLTISACFPESQALNLYELFENIFLKNYCYLKTN